MEPLIWYIEGPEDLKIKEFSSKYAPQLEEILEDPNASIIITDRPGCAIQTARYLSKHGYRKCCLYHVGKPPRHSIGKFNSKGGFSSLNNCKKQMFRDCNKYFCPKG